MPGEIFAQPVVVDGLVHGWDLAPSTTGQAYATRAAMVAAVDELAREALTEDMRDGDTFKDATTPPTGACRLGSLVAFTGRSV